MLVGRGRIAGLSQAALEVRRLDAVRTEPERAIVAGGGFEVAAAATEQVGARGVVLKESATSMLLKAIRIVMDGGYWVGRESVSDLLQALYSLGPVPERPEALPAFSLTPREIQIVGLILAAAGNKKIADTLNISEKTVKHHLTNIFEKLGVSNRLELALFAAQHNLLPKE